MNNKKKIYITGCAKSGTTLVRRLFNAFELDVYNYYEMSIDSFMESKYNVAKRKYNTILSRKLDKKEESRQLEIIKNIFIVNVIRNKADVLKSDNGYVPEARYDSCMEQASRLSDDIDFTLSYDDLLCDPDRAQEEISEKLNLKIIHKWSDYPKFMKGIKERYSKSNINELRPIGTPKKV